MHCIRKNGRIQSLSRWRHHIPTVRVGTTVYTLMLSKSVIISEKSHTCPPAYRVPAEFGWAPGTIWWETSSAYTTVLAPPTLSYFRVFMFSDIISLTCGCGAVCVAERMWQRCAWQWCVALNSTLWDACAGSEVGWVVLGSEVTNIMVR
jgi:hypothetical protein